MAFFSILLACDKGVQIGNHSFGVDLDGTRGTDPVAQETARTIFRVGQENRIAYFAENIHGTDIHAFMTDNALVEINSVYSHKIFPLM